MAPPLVITGTLLRNFVTCERRIWLDAYGRAEDKVAVNPVGMQAGIEHENIIQTAVGETIGEPLIFQSWEEGVKATYEAMRAGVSWIIGAMVELRIEIEKNTTVILRGKIDRLIRNAHSIYEPIEIKRYKKLTEADFLQLDLYLLILQQMQNSRLKGYFWLGKDETNHPLIITPHEPDLPRLKKILQSINKIVSINSPPLVRLEPHCDKCPWNASCFNVARSQLDLGLLHRLDRRSRLHLEQQGVTTLKKFVELSIEELQNIIGIKSGAAVLHAHARAYLENRPIWLSKVPDMLNRGGWMLDLETAALPGGDGLPWSIGWGDEKGYTQVVLVVPGQSRSPIQVSHTSLLTIASNKDEAWEVFHESVGKDSKPIYHWSNFDARTMNSTAPDKVKNALLGRMHDLHRTFLETVRLPLKSYSVKEVGTYLGFKRSSYENWWEAENDYRHWLLTGDNESLRRVYNYQNDDVLALSVIWNWLLQNQGLS